MSFTNYEESAIANRQIQPSPQEGHSLFVLADCNNFFVSCERIFDPRLEGKPVVVLSNNDACIISRSNEAKKLGIKMGVPLHQVTHIVKSNHVHVRSANFTLYRDLSRRVTHCLRQFCPNLEVYSVDEVFMTLQGMDRKTIDTMIIDMKQTVSKWVGIPVSIGVAETKTLAKLCTDYAKKEMPTIGCFDLSVCSQRVRDSVLAGTEVNDIWGIGHAYSNWLTNHGIMTALQLREIDQKWFSKKAGIVGLRTVKELQGISCIPLKLVSSPRKAITCSRSFGKLVTNLQELKEAIATFAAHSGKELRHDRSLARCVTVHCRVRSRTTAAEAFCKKTMNLSLPTDRDSELIHAAIICLEQIYLPDLAYYKGGITLSDLSSADVYQTDIFSHNEHDSNHGLSRIIDKINTRWGHGTIRYAATGTHQNWRSRAALRSPNYTTCWQELPVAYTETSLKRGTASRRI